MRDTRLLQLREILEEYVKVKAAAKSLLGDADSILAELDDEVGGGEIHTLIDLAQARRFLASTVDSDDTGNILVGLAGKEIDALDEKPCNAHACPHPLGHEGSHQTDWRLSPMCKCGHRQYDHLSLKGRCDDGRKMCGCQQFVAAKDN